jgi:branched-chain amino acid transport system permease protein
MNIFLGPALGAGIMVILNSFITAHTQYWGLCMGATLIAIVLVFPQGVGGLIYEKYRSRRAER